MNQRVVVLRRAVEQIIKILTDRDIPVTQRGTQAFVESDPRTHEPTRVNLPYVPDNASDEFIDALHGFLDHEGGHLMFSNFEVISEAHRGGKRLANMHNIIEDTFIERKMCERFLGSGENIDNVQKFFLSNFTEPELEKALAKGDKSRAIGILLVPAYRALAGQEVFEKFMEENEHWPMLQPIMDKINEYDPELLGKIPHIQNSKEALEIARGIEEATKEPPEKDESESEDDGDGKSGSGDSESDEPDGSGSKDSSEKGESSESPSDKNDDEESVDGDGSSSGDEETGEEDDEDSGDSGDSDGGGAGGDSDADKENKDYSADDGDKEGDGEGDKSESSSNGEKDEGVKPDKGAPEELPPEFYKAMDEAPDFDDAVSDSLSDISHETAGAADYIPYTKDFDEIKPLEVKYDYRDQYLTNLDDAAREAVGPLQKTLERLILAQTKRRWHAGLRSGRVNPGALHRLKVGDDRLFRKREISKTKEVAMTLLVDNSGSMTGNPMTTAMISAYAMSQALDRIGVKHEVIGFTTLPMGCFSASDEKAIKEQESKMGRPFSRYEPIHMPIYKGFDEPLGIPQKKRLAYANATQKFLRNNLDGESIEYAAARLIAQRESGKILCVLSDGSPAAVGPSRDQNNHLRRMVRELNKKGVQTFGIGIMDSSVSYYYDDYIVLHDVNELPGEIMKDLKKFLLDK